MEIFMEKAIRKQIDMKILYRLTNYLGEKYQYKIYKITILISTVKKCSFLRPFTEITTSLYFFFDTILLIVNPTIAGLSTSLFFFDNFEEN